MTMKRQEMRGWLAGALLLVGAASPLPAAATGRAAADAVPKVTVKSPDGLTFLDVALENGCLLYNAGYYRPQGKDTARVVLVEDSPLGLYTNIGDFSQGLVWKRHTPGEQRKTYSLRQSKVSQVNYEARTLDVEVQNAKQQTICVRFEVSNANIAFRYQLPMQGETAAIVVNGEATGFDFPSQTTTFLCPQSDPMIGWKRTKPSYEEEYTPDEALGTPSKYGRGYTFPCLFHVGGDGWVLVSETGVSGNYCGSHLSEGTPDGLYTIAFPMEGENNGFGSTGAQLGLPGVTPWRTLTLGPTLAPVMETTVPYDVVAPLYEPSVAYKGGRSTWSWIIWQDASIVYEDQKTFIDLAADLGWEYCLIDGGWETNIGRPRMEELFAYCRQKGIAPFVWYNSNGGWNDAPQCAKQCMYSPIVRKKEMKWLRDHGVKGIKVDFFAGDKQETLRLYEAILSDANDYGIQVIFHGCTLPRGWERMYPNYCSSEAVLASENLVFNQHFDDAEAFNACLHPFIRNTVGSMEFGGTILNRRLNRENNGGTVRRTGDIFQLATAVAFQSSVQNFALTPNNLTEQPAFEIDFMKQVPTEWDEVKFIDGYPGRYVVMARRAGEHWYVVAMNAEAEARKCKVSLPVLAGQSATYYYDDKDGAPHMETVKIGKKGEFTFTVPTNGGAMLKL